MTKLKKILATVLVASLLTGFGASVASFASFLFLTSPDGNCYTTDTNKTRYTAPQGGFIYNYFVTTHEWPEMGEIVVDNAHTFSNYFGLEITEEMDNPSNSITYRYAINPENDSAIIMDIIPTIIGSTKILIIPETFGDHKVKGAEIMPSHFEKNLYGLQAIILPGSLKYATPQSFSVRDLTVYNSPISDDKVFGQGATYFCGSKDEVLSDIQREDVFAKKYSAF